MSDECDRTIRRQTGAAGRAGHRRDGGLLDRFRRLIGRAAWAKPMRTRALFDHDRFGRVHLGLVDDLSNLARASG